MPFQHDHSENLPRKFEECPRCGLKGLFKTTNLIEGRGLKKLTRCKYCRYFKAEDTTPYK